MLQIGTIVKLATGGPEMVVRETPVGRRTLCQWFEEDRFQQAYFDSKVLVEVYIPTGQELQQ